MRLIGMLTFAVMWSICGLVVNNPAEAAAPEHELSVGWAAADITPPKPVNLQGQMHKRISKEVKDPITATILALESGAKDGPKEQAVLISCDLASIWKIAQDAVRQRVKARLPDFDSDKLFLSATHTHTGPTLADFYKAYDVSKDPGVMNATEYREFFADRLAAAVVQAWQGRKPGGMSWGLGQAVVGHNRRAVYFDGKAAMYGNTNTEQFDAFEGYEDHGVEMLFFWNPEKELTGMVVNVACPSQETEGESYLSADFWYEVRQEIKQRYSKDVHVLAQCGAAGDQSPHLLVRKQAENRMQARRKISRREEIGRRIAAAVDDVFPIAKNDIRTKLVFKHAVVRLNLPPQQPPVLPFYDTDPIQPIEFHVFRLGEVALATNPFELYVDYGMRMKARSKAVLTLIAQLSCQTCGYLPTARGVRGGGYSADKFLVGPEGGQVLVNETVQRINAMWE
jgi:hypothetical protein